MSHHHCDGLSVATCFELDINAFLMDFSQKRYGFHIKKIICYLNLAFVQIPDHIKRIKKLIYCRAKGFLYMDILENSGRIRDNGGTRSTADRRQCPSIGFSPERRSGTDRRGGTDRRNVQIDRGSHAIERREFFRATKK
jgi:hypothetical protein